MIDTPHLITRLGHDLAPVRRLRKPLVRALIWLSFAGVLMGMSRSRGLLRLSVESYVKRQAPVFHSPAVSRLDRRIGKG